MLLIVFVGSNGIYMSVRNKLEKDFYHKGEGCVAKNSIPGR